MRRVRSSVLPACLLVLAALSSLAHVRAQANAASAAAPSPASREAAWRQNNVGVAQLEQFRFAEAAETFKKALATDPTLHAARVNLAIAYLYVPDIPAARQAAGEAVEAQPDDPYANYLLALVARTEGRAEEAVPYVQKVLAKDPKDLGANVTLGQVYLQMRRYDEAAKAFRIAAEAEPYNVSAAYNLGVALTRSGQREEGQAAMQRFQKLRDSAYKSALGSTYMEQGKYAEAIASTGAEADAVDPKTPAVTLVEKPAAVPAAAKVQAPQTRSALVLADLDGDGVMDGALAAGPTLRVLRGTGRGLEDATAKAGLADVAAVAAVAADYDNDARADLLVLKPSGLALYRNEGEGRFKDASAAARLPQWPYRALTAALVDIDHDGDLDAFVAGFADAAGAPAPSLLLQNNGDGTFADVTERAQLGGAGRAVAVVPTDFDNRRDVDLLVLREDAPVLFKNMRDGSFRDVAADVGLAAAKGPFRCAAAGDVNKDGFVDFFLGAAGPSWLATSDGRGGYAVSAAPEGAADAQAAQIVDYDADGLLDLLALTTKGARLYRNVGSGRWADVSSAALAVPLRSAALGGASLAVADLDGDGDADAVLAGPQRLAWLSNEGGAANRSFAVTLSGRVSNKGAVGAKVDIRAGSLRQKIETSAAVPMAAPADVVFGLGRREAPDAVRVIWVSGIVQTETDVGAAAKPAEPGKRAALAIAELDRKPSSCPYLYAWSGERFEFVTDFLGAGEMGYYLAPGVRNVPDPVEYVRIAPGALVPREGRYELRVTNELEEVLYLDQLRLLAVDHPAEVSVYPDEGMTGAPKPHRLFAVRDARPVKAFDHRGRDVTARLARLDRSFADELPVERIRGYAKEHSLSLDLSGLPDGHTLLLLTGWTDYAFSSDNVAAHQAGLKMVPPRLEVESPDGTWTTAVEEIGIPVGRPQTIVVDLAGRLTSTRRARVVTTMRVYWDQVAAGAPAEGLALEPRPLAARVAALGERGFSRETSPDGREPWSYDYARVSYLSPWKTMAGRYTRLGDVGPLLDRADDTFVVSKPGDEVALSFDAAALSPPRPGLVRTFLLHATGYSKEMDINSASPDVVLPLPYRGMKDYPYAEHEAPPRVREAQAKAAEWNAREVRKPLPPIELWAEGAGRPGSAAADGGLQPAPATGGR